MTDEIDQAATSRRVIDALETALTPERVMVCVSSAADAQRVIRLGARIAKRLGTPCYAVYVETPQEAPDRIRPQDSAALRQNIALAEEFGATVVRVKAKRPAEFIRQGA